MKLWIVGQNRSELAEGIVWEFAGVFDSEAAAVVACRDARYFVMPCALNETQPHETVKADDCYYPLGVRAAE